MFEKVQFSRSNLSDFVGGSPINTKTACIEAVFKNGAADKNRTYDPVITKGFKIFLSDELLTKNILQIVRY